MGVVTSVPAPVKIHLESIQATKFEYILDSNHYENNYLFIRKACNEVSKNKSIQKVVLKLFFPKTEPEQDLTKPLAKLLQTKGTVIIYGNNMHFFNNAKWVKIWNLTKTTNLQIKFEMTMIAFDYLIEGITGNKNVKIMGFRYLNDAQLIRISECLAHNPNLYHIQIVLENRIYSLENIEDGINSIKMPGTPQVGLPISFMSQAKSVTTYTLGGYQERSTFIAGIIRNRSIKTLILENIDIEKHLRHDWNVSFKENSTVDEIRTVRGLNTISAMILFQSLRKNSHISTLQLEESVFFDHAFWAFETLLKATVSLKKIVLKNLLHLNITRMSQASPIKNLCKILTGLAGNNSVVEVYVSNHPASSADIIKLEDKENALSAAFCEFLKKNTVVKVLSLEHLRIGGESFPGICEGFCSNGTLNVFSLKGNLMDWGDLANFLMATRSSMSLTSVDFNGNRLFKDIDNVPLELFDRVFITLSESNLRNFGIDGIFWGLKAYPSLLFPTISQCKQKYEESKHN
ncbi:hypothetical protein SteCoe_22625 [Stentor coeruleus]|uniref:Uncharacterized protein n=1 Tax=Stentor coeruleus TaxID=5963 RepID=A0A1R2BLU4_9CILI|nr:hypothetical protein SteCoe_22625 [Stentor coeruleus]